MKTIQGMVEELFEPYQEDPVSYKSDWEADEPYSGPPSGIIAEVSFRSSTGNRWEGAVGFCGIPSRKKLYPGEGYLLMVWTWDERAGEESACTFSSRVGGKVSTFPLPDLGADEKCWLLANLMAVQMRQSQEEATKGVESDPILELR
jgi:hypothetical protein